ncbi:cobalamin biosynthesis protein CobW [Pseudomonas sp. PA15(2017)]|uniref:CobW family GTP-binding protein n=1 Tax=Pseudomonas sp. PA15(2017) TaxID=1932111 RepID=UPI00095EA08B|nr:CobW-like GTP-binding protein [Pseudomonas sp. PA15(2017)]OLU24738.1 cobalamin biosynthesis protein CobW [Pseudomonas sp. PA15(2017)]
MMNQIPTHLIAGPLGAGKTSLIHQLLAQRPADERWAVLINEFGQIGLDAALLARDEDGLSFSEVAGGCLCCVNGVPFQVGLGRLLRKATPDRLFIEPSGLGHPLSLLEQLGQEPWDGVLAVQPLLMVLDAAALAAGEPLAESQREALAHARLLVLNKSEGLDDASRVRLTAELPLAPYWTSQGRLPFEQLPRAEARAASAGGVLPDGPRSPSMIWRSADEPICLIQDQPEGWSIGWRWHPSQRFDLLTTQQWLARLPWRRAKLVLQTNAGWLSINALEGQALHWQNSEWRKDSRLELIFAGPQDEATLRTGMAACRL